eukprot:COSAG01_NODE_5601_length_4153_cov_74.330291_3_plen_188_part_00
MGGWWSGLLYHAGRPQTLRLGVLARSRWLFCGPKPAAVVATAPPSCSTVVGSAGGGARSGFCARVLTLAYVLRRPRDGKPGMCPNPGGRVARSLARSRWLFCEPKPAAVVATSPPSCSTVVGSAGGDQIGVLRARSDPRVRAAQAKRWTRGRSMAGGRRSVAAPLPCTPASLAPHPPLSVGVQISCS